MYSTTCREDCLERLLLKVQVISQNHCQIHTLHQSSYNESQQTSLFTEEWPPMGIDMPKSLKRANMHIPTEGGVRGTAWVPEKFLRHSYGT